jgi:hypothetical protein
MDRGVFRIFDSVPLHTTQKAFAIGFLPFIPSDSKKANSSPLGWSAQPMAPKVGLSQSSMAQNTIPLTVAGSFF